MELVCLLPKRQELVLKNNHRILKWSLITHDITAVRDGDFTNLTTVPQENSDNAILFRSGPAAVRYLDADSLADVADVDLSNFAGVTTFQGAVYEELSDSLILLANNAPARRLRLRRVKGGTARYADMIGTIGGLAGLIPLDMDTAEVTGEVDGYLINREGSLQAALSPILMAAGLDLTETGYQLAFKPKTSAAVIDVDVADLIQQPEFTRLQEAELPERMSVRYLASDGGYLPGVQTATRADRPIATMQGRNETSLNFAMAMGADKAKAISQNSLKSAWQERDVVRLGLPMKYLYLDPSDRIRLIYEGGSQEVQISQSHLQTDFAQDVTALGGVAAADVKSEVIADAGSGYVAPTLSRPQKTTLFLFNGSLLRDQDATGGAGSRLYYAFGVPDARWRGAGLYQSSDNIRYDMAGSSQMSVAHGITAGALAGTDHPWRTDTENGLELEIISGADRFETVSMADLSSGRNSLLIGEEVIQFGFVEWISSSRVRLKNLLRGRRGTEAQIHHHKMGERAILLEADSIRSLTLPLSAINTRRYFKAVTAGELPEDVAPTVIIPAGGDLKPYAPVHLKAVRSAGEVVISWTRRSRSGGVSLSKSPPLSEATERYELRITYAGKAVSHYITGATEFIYQLADFNADFNVAEGEIPPLDLSLYQLSEAIGRGHPAVKEDI